MDFKTLLIDAIFFFHQSNLVESFGGHDGGSFIFYLFPLTFYLRHTHPLFSAYRMKSASVPPLTNRVARSIST